MRAELDPLEGRGGIGQQVGVFDHALEFEPGLVLGFPDLGGQGAAHGAGVFTRGHQAAADARRVVGIGHHVLHHALGRDGAVAGGEIAAELRDAQQALPALFGRIGRLRQQRGLVVDVQHAGGVFGPLHVAGHPEQVIGGS